MPAPFGVVLSPVTFTPMWSNSTSGIALGSIYSTPSGRTKLRSILSSGDGRITASMASAALEHSDVESFPNANIGMRRLVGHDGVTHGNLTMDHLATVTGLADPFVENANGTIRARPFSRAVGDNVVTSNHGQLSATAASFTPMSHAIRSIPNAKSGGVALPIVNTPASQPFNRATCVVNGSTSGTGTATDTDNRPIQACIIFKFDLQSMWRDPAVSRLIGDLMAMGANSDPNAEILVVERGTDELHVGFRDTSVLRSLVSSIRERKDEWHQVGYPLFSRVPYCAQQDQDDQTIVYVKMLTNSADEEFIMAGGMEDVAAATYEALARHGPVVKWDVGMEKEALYYCCFRARFLNKAHAAEACDTLNKLQLDMANQSRFIYGSPRKPKLGGALAPLMVHFKRVPAGQPIDTSVQDAINGLEAMNLGSGAINGGQYPVSGNDVLAPSGNMGAVPAPVPHPIGYGRPTMTQVQTVPAEHHHMQVAPYQPVRRMNAGNNGRRNGGRQSDGNRNIVHVERIREGQDVRTTIMLRNIPNKLDQPTLKAIVDETSFGKYDFMYLRIDFGNMCNVGYAFINFENPGDIIDFVNARAGYHWNCYNSDKVAEISYATIQGKDCLVQKFRNSSVMLENPLFRPKIFYTGDHPLVGQEEAFPEPDNNSKMRRSVENAAHIGLFAPGGGNNPRHEQRRRRSQFDRGTRLAQIEEEHGYIPQTMNALSFIGNAAPGPVHRPQFGNPVTMQPIGTRPGHGPIGNGNGNNNNFREGGSIGPRLGN
ncbi:MAG: hypothetical protein M1823_000395 [Watsoniomyces obsoletus]|nr:MAG: hypothetical protein M1823_000395 [Watsoniomyces obsoletus]